MLISFIGPPCSGKTTTAARLFADLKDLGYPTEFLPEVARYHIATKINRLQPGEPLILTDSDQFNILCEQSEREQILNQHETIVVTDSSVLNTPLYMTSISPQTEEQIHLSLKRYDLIFRCPPVQPPCIQDPHRVHSFEQSLRLDKELTNLLLKFNVTSIFLSGDTRHRTQQATAALLSKIANE